MAHRARLCDYSSLLGKPKLKGIYPYQLPNATSN